MPSEVRLSITDDSDGYINVGSFGTKAKFVIGYKGNIINSIENGGEEVDATSGRLSTTKNRTKSIRSS